MLLERCQSGLSSGLGKAVSALCGPRVRIPPSPFGDSLPSCTSGAGWTVSRVAAGFEPQRGLGKGFPQIVGVTRRQADQRGRAPMEIRDGGFRFEGEARNPALSVFVVRPLDPPSADSGQACVMRPPRADLRCASILRPALPTDESGLGMTPIIPYVTAH